MKRRAWMIGICMVSSGIQAHWWDSSELQLNAGPTFNFARYTLGTLPKIQGYLAGVHTDFQYQAECGVYSRIEFDGRWNAGFVCGDQDTKSSIDDYRPQWFLGYSWSLWCDALTITPFTGYGFYYLSDMLNPDIMTLRYFNNYVPIGFLSEWEQTPDYFYIRLLALYRPEVHTRLKLNTPALDPETSSKLKLNRSHGVHVEMPLRWLIHRCEERVEFQLKVVPYFDWNRFGSTKQINENGIPFAVPRLDRWYLGLHVDLGLCF